MFDIYVRTYKRYSTVRWMGIYTIFNGGEQVMLHRREYPYANMYDVGLLSVSAAIRSAKNLGAKEIAVHMERGKALDMLCGNFPVRSSYINVVNEIQQQAADLQVHYIMETKKRIMQACPGKLLTAKLG